MNSFFKTVRTETWLLLICIIAFFLRVRGLDNQSLWLDELHTMNEANPDGTWGDMFHYLKNGDQHPPLYFILERISFSIFNDTAFVARMLSVLAGTAGVWAMYRLGKEILNKQLGMIGAVLTCINFYSIFYSQEARPYSFAFLFAALSFTWFIRLIRTPSKKTAIQYAVFTLLLLYSHYYSLFVVAAQGFLALLFIFQEQRTERKILFRSFLLGGIIILIGYAPWLSFLLKMSQIKTFWITDVPTSFLQSFFYDYFGNADLLNPLLILLLFAFFIRVALYSEIESLKKIKDDPLLFSFTLILFWVFIVLLIPYVRSLLMVPMLYPRYTIVILPAILLLIAYSIELFKVKLIKYSVLVLFILLSSIHIFFVKKYYIGTSKTQFREMTQYVVSENTSKFPIINEFTGWHQGYYLRLYGSKAELLAGTSKDLIDSILRKGTHLYDLRGFWVVGAQGSKPPDSMVLRSLDTAYTLLKEKDFYDAWARCYVAKKYQEGNYYVIPYSAFVPGEGEILAGAKNLSIWHGAVHSLPVMVKKGKYTLTVKALGTIAANQYPHLNIYANGKKLGDYFLTDKMEEKDIEFNNENDENVIFMIEMDNDLFIPAKHEDRNVLLESIVLKRIN